MQSCSHDGLECSGEKKYSSAVMWFLEYSGGTTRGAKKLACDCQVSVVSSLSLSFVQVVDTCSP